MYYHAKFGSSNLKNDPSIHAPYIITIIQGIKYSAVKFFASVFKNIDECSCGFLSVHATISVAIRKTNVEIQFISPNKAQKRKIKWINR